MHQLVTKAIVLTRTNFGEADRILTVLTSDQGKVRLMARGVRRAKAKLAGAVELFGVSDITFVRGRGEIATLTSARLVTNFSNIIKSIERINLAYEFLRIINKNTEDEIEVDYFRLLESTLTALDDADISLGITRFYFEANLLRLAGHTPNLTSDSRGKPLEIGQKYEFDTGIASFSMSPSGQYSAREVKFLRLAFSGNSVKILARVSDAKSLVISSQPLVKSMLEGYLRV